jgi:hypothetical protein
MVDYIIMYKIETFFWGISDKSSIMPAVLEMKQVGPVPGDPSKLEPSTSPRQLQILKNNYYGIEVINNVVWQGWEPGREYTKNIVLKNVNVKTQKIKYK